MLLRVPTRTPCLRLRDSHPVSWAFPVPFGSAPRPSCRPFNPASRGRRFGLFHFRSPLLAESSLFLRVLRCFSSPGSLSLAGVTHSAWAGFPHSDTAGSMPAHGSPALFAVYHVLLRPLSPRHPPPAFFHFLPRAETTPAFFTRLLSLAYFRLVLTRFYSFVKVPPGSVASDRRLRLRKRPSPAPQLWA